MAPFSHLVENSIRRRLGVQNRVKSSDKEGRQTFCPSAFPSLQFESHQLVGIDLGISRIPTWRMKFWFALSVCQRGPETSNSWSTLNGIFFWNYWNCWKVKYCLNKPTTPQHFWRYDNCQWGLMTSEQKQPLEISTSWCPRSLWFSNITGESSSTSTNSTC